MNSLKQIAIVLVISAPMLFAGCYRTDTETSTTPAPTATATPSPTPTSAAANETPVTLPLIDALFYSDAGFANDLKTNLQLTDDQIARLRDVAREETLKLRESHAGDQPEYQGSTTAAAELAKNRVVEVVGDEKARKLSDLALRRWSGEEAAATATPAPGASPASTASPMTTVSPGAAASPAATRSPSPSVSPSAPGTAGSAMTPFGLAPSDTRVVVNTPAYRMDVFKDGKLIKSYKIGIGYPEFPLPTGMRRATTIIFNPAWTPPDEPWVEASGKHKVGEKVEAGGKSNPLGVIKIPIGLPSLIHGGKSPSMLGQFASHGCVGLTDKQIKDFAKSLADLGGVELTDQEIAQKLKTPSKTEDLKLRAPTSVELRYETIVAEDGKLHIYRDVYERGSNTEENLRRALMAYGVTIDQLSQDERAQVQHALEEMSRGPGGKPGGDSGAEQEDQQKQRNIERGKVTRTIKGRKVAVIKIAALAGKGYPAPVEMDTGGGKGAVVSWRKNGSSATNRGA